MLPVAVYLSSTSVRDKFARVKMVASIKDGRTSTPAAHVQEICRGPRARVNGMLCRIAVFLLLTCIPSFAQDTNSPLWKLYFAAMTPTRHGSWNIKALFMTNPFRGRGHAWVTPTIGEIRPAM
jgi:hypothetical protein